MFGIGASVAAMTIAVSIPACCIAVIQGWTSGKAFMSMARQPGVARTIRNLLMICLAFMETLAIYGLLIAFLLYSIIW